MAFTSAEKRQIRSYLGYSGGFRDRGVRLESMMDVVGNQTDEAAYARELLATLTIVENTINSGATVNTASGTLKKVDELEWYPVTTATLAVSGAIVGRDLGEILIERLRALMGVELAGRYFRKSTLMGDPFPLG